MLTGAWPDARVFFTRINGAVGSNDDHDTDKFLS
jgi:hypothetical protein